jgi:hypothetical protein
MDKELYYSLLDSIDDYRHFYRLIDNWEGGHYCDGTQFMVSQYRKGRVDVVRDFNYKLKVR